MNAHGNRFTNASDLGEYTGSAAPESHVPSASNHDAAAAPSEQSTRAIAADSHELVERWAAIWNGDLALIPATVHDDYVSHAAPLLGGAPVDSAGAEHLAGWVAGIRAAIPDLHFTVQVGPVVDGPYVTVRWFAQGTYAGGVPGTPAGAVGRAVTFPSARR